MIVISDVEEIRAIDRKIRTLLGPGALPEYTVEPIPSGVPILLRYERGALSTALTRGETFGSRDVTRNVKTILAVPLVIHSILAGKEPPPQLNVWGVVYAEKSELGSSGPYRSALEMVSTCLIGADVRDTAKCPLNMFCYGAEKETEWCKGIGAESHIEVMRMLQDWGFRVNRPHIRLCAEVSEAIEAVRLLEEKREPSSFELSGALVQLNSLQQQSALARTSDLHRNIHYEFPRKE
ncbi:MAG: hypothetical protein C4576_23160 [Desulfobacteraceae bacterium]|nr:MAG: hypothetical protein C4576_23160 [Desulfobacteraceae bacterium]